MSVAFPAGYYPDKARPVEESLNVLVDYMDSGAAELRVLGNDTYTMWDIDLGYLTSAEFSTLRTFYLTNRAEEITWTLDGIDYIGNIIGPIRRHIVGNGFMVKFKYYAKEAS